MSFRRIGRKRQVLNDRGYLRQEFNQAGEIKRMSYDYGKDANDKTGQRITATFSTQFAAVNGPGNTMGTGVFANDDIKISRGTAANSFDILGNVLDLNGTSQYVYVNSDELNIYKNSFMLSFFVRFSSLNLSAGYPRIIAKGASFRVYIQNVDNLIYMYLNDGTNSYNFSSGNPKLSENVWYQFSFVGERNADDTYTGYTFLDGDFYASQNSSVSFSEIYTSNDFRFLDSYGEFVDDVIFDEMRFFLFGDYGIYSSGTPGVDLILRVGNSSGPLLWSDTDPESSLVRKMYKSPAATLTELGFPELENADRTENSPNPTCDTDITGWSNYNSGTVSHETTTTYEGAGALRSTYDGTAAWGGKSSIITLSQANCWYEMSAWVYIPSGFSGGEPYLTDGSTYAGNVKVFSFPDMSIRDTWQKTRTLIKIASDVVGQIYFYGNSPNPANGDYVIWDNIEFKRIGEIAHWRLNESGTPATLVDETDNSFDLTTSGSPSMVTNDYIRSRIYNTVNPHTGTISFWIRPSWAGNDGASHYICYERVSSSDYIRVYKDTSNNLSFTYVADGNAVSVSTSISSWNAGEWHFVTAVFSKNSIDGTDYLHLYIDGSEVNSSTTSLSYPSGVESSWDFGQYNAAYSASGIIAGFCLSEVPFKGTTANAIAAGLPPECSVEYLYNSGSGRNAVCNEFVRFLYGN